MPLKNALKKEYKRLAFVGVAFFLMALVSNVYVVDMVKKQMDLYHRSDIQVYKITLRSLIQAQEAVLMQAVGAIVTALEKGSGPDELQTLLRVITGSIRDQKNVQETFVNIYGYIDGSYLDGSSLAPGSPEAAPWLSGAPLPSGVYHSRPHIDARTGQMVNSISTAVFDRNGERRGVLAVDHLLAPVTKMVQAYKVGYSGFSFLLDGSFTVLTFPDPGLVGRQISDGPEFASLEKSLSAMDDQALLERAVTIGGVRHIGFFSRLENGWFLGVAAPLNHSFGQTAHITMVIFSLALVLSCGLGLVLVRMASDIISAEEKSRSKTSFLARMSHEIRTPLNAILGLSLLARRNYGASEGLKYLGEINRTGNHLLVIINDLLDLSKVESGYLAFKHEPYRTKTIISDILSIARIRTIGLSLTVEVKADPNIPAKLIGDEWRVRQILMNLTSNAVKYTPAGFVRLGVSGWPTVDGRIRLVFKVEDSGIGIKPHQLESLFEEFVRLDEQSNTKPIEGAGLGLPITRTLCRAMGGDITVTSEFGRGSAFRAEIIQGIADPSPMGDIEQSEPELQAGEEDGVPPPAFTFPGCKVLVIDDIATNLVVAEGLLSFYEVKATTCLSGRLGVEAAKKERFDLIFIDHVMPDLDGLATLKALREADEYLKKTPMVALTASAMEGMREMFLSNGFDDYLAKPISLGKLEEIMTRWIPMTGRLPAEGIKQSN